MKPEIVQVNADVNRHNRWLASQGARANKHTDSMQIAERDTQFVEFECRYCNRNFNAFAELVEHFLATHRTGTV